jgi:NADPH:quinone reductase-like Zn-dependent oxidoreductase
MKAIRYEKYGSAEVVQLVDSARPEPKDDQVLIRIVESILTPSDIASRKGEPALIRLFSGLTRPKAIPGSDLAGVVAAAGSKVTRFEVGDRIFGAASPATGTHAEYICLPDSAVLAPLPDSIPFASSAGFCDAAMTALTFLRDIAHLESGQHLLINGASGAIGTFAIQLAKHFGAHVTAVCSTPKIDLVRSLGADEVIDYTQVDFTSRRNSYDVIFDAVGKSSFAQSKLTLKPEGIYLSTVPSTALLIQTLRSRFSSGRRAVFSATGLMQTQEKLNYLLELLTAGKLKSVVDRHYSLSEMKEAHHYVESERKRGNLIIDVQPEAA